MSILLVIVSLLITDPGKIGKINTLKTEARKAYAAADYATAVEKYRLLTDSLQVKEDEITMNLANAYFQLNDSAQAQSSYQQLLGSTNPSIRSTAHQQLGVMNNRQGKFDEALNNFKQAIKADPANRDARYNYEMLKKKLEAKRQQEEKEKNKDKNKAQKPSEYAKRLKEQADALVRRNLFQDAHTLMTDGLKQDPSVSYYQDFIERLNTVVTINQGSR